MKKFYSLVLMATALLIGTNAWADVTDWAGLKSALEAGGKVTLTQDIPVTVTDASWQGCWIGAADIAATAKSAELDLAGHSITITANSSDIAIYPFVITKGELKVVNSSSKEAVIDVLVQSTSTAKSTNVFSVYGSYDYNQDPKAANPFTHLEIGTNVKVNTNNGTVIAIDQKVASKPASFATTNYHTDYLYTTNSKGQKSYYGFAFGVRVDVKGTLISQGGYKCYGIKTNGLLAYPGDTKKTVNTADWITADYKAHVADSASIAHAPYVHVWSTAVINSDNNRLQDASAAVYASGYAQWLIEGSCDGATGLYASSGDIDIAGEAKISSSADEYYQPNGAGHADATGSAIVINSRDAYAGAVEVSISGDVEVSSKVGYAIEEAVNTTKTTDPTTGEEKKETKVENITITGGTFQGGQNGGEDMPAIIISSSTSKDSESEVVVYGGNVEGALVVDGDATKSLDDFVPTTAHTTTIKDETGKVIATVVSEGVAPTVANSVIAAADNASIKWQNTTTKNETLSSNLVLKELEITETYAQTLTIAEGATLKVGRVVLGPKAQIVVEAGAKFIVNGEQGFVATSNDNFLLKATEAKRAIFLFHPDVESNRHPNATVEFFSKSFVDGSNYASQRFGIPAFGELASVEAVNSETSAAVRTRFYSLDLDANSWISLGYINGGASDPAFDKSRMAEPFAYYQMYNYATTANTKVIMKGQLFGNDSPELSVRGNFWNGYANTYMGPMNILALIDMIPDEVQKAIYLYDITSDQTSWEPLNLLDATSTDAIQPMQPFLIRNTNAAGVVPVDYADAVYYPTTGETKPGAAPAPRRAAASNITKAKLIVKGENCIDRVTVAESADFSAEFDNGYDAAKYMNDGINMYVSADEKMSIFATDNLENTYVGFQSVNGGNYTIEFANVQGEELTLIDYETGARVAMVEGTTYEFNADANTVNDYRFEIVGRANMPTAIDNTEAVKSAKGVYTITGQYVGEMNVWNTLPAGVYVVNGEKRVK